MGLIWVNAPAYFHWQEPGRPQSSSPLTLAWLHRERLNCWLGSFYQSVHPSMRSDPPVIPWLLGKSIHNISIWQCLMKEGVVLRESVICGGWAIDVAFITQSAWESWAWSVLSVFQPQGLELVLSPAPPHLCSAPDCLLHTQGLITHLWYHTGTYTQTMF